MATRDLRRLRLPQDLGRAVWADGMITARLVYYIGENLLKVLIDFLLISRGAVKLKKSINTFNKFSPM